MFSFRRDKSNPKARSRVRTRKSPRRQLGQSAFERLEAREVFSVSPGVEIVAPRENWPPVVLSPIVSNFRTEIAAHSTYLLSQIFYDSDLAAGRPGEKLTYSVESNDNPDVVSVTISGDTMTLDFSPGESGRSRITIHATDSMGGFAPLTFIVAKDQKYGYAVRESTPSVDTLYHDLLGREADAAGKEFWSQEFDKPNGARHVAEGLLASDEHIESEIKQLYRDYLGHEADAEGVAFWRDKAWKQPGGRGNVLAGILGSEEYFAKHGETTSSLVDGMYRDLTGHLADEEGGKFWAEQIDQRHLSVGKVALELTQTDEYSRRQIDGWTSRYRGYAPSPGDGTLWMDQMHKGRTLHETELDILSSSRFEWGPVPNQHDYFMYPENAESFAPWDWDTILVTYSPNP